MSGVFMYRKGEARLFASPDDVPAGEGWVDSPAKVDDVAADAGPHDETHSDTAPSEIDVLRARAAELGLTVDNRWSAKRIARMIDAAEKGE